MSDPARWIERAAARGASDLVLVPDAPPRVRVGGELQELAPEALTAEEVSAAAESLRGGARCLPPPARGGARWLVERDSGLIVRALVTWAPPAVSVRLHPASARTPQQLGLPPEALVAWTRSPGLLLVAGPPGSGRSTTLAAALRVWERGVGGRLLLAGAPCDGTLRPERALVTEACLVGGARAGTAGPRGFTTVEEALAVAGPAGVDAVAVPRLPTLGAVERALDLASSGVAVFVVEAGRSAPDALRRLVSKAPAGGRRGLRRRLALALSGVVAQQLVPRRDDNEPVAVFDLLHPSPQARWLVAEGAWGVLESHMEGGDGPHLASLDAALSRLVLDGVVDAQTAAEHAGDRDAFVRRPGVAQALDAVQG